MICFVIGFYVGCITFFIAECAIEIFFWINRKNEYARGYCDGIASKIPNFDEEDRK